jgi:threonine dehydrogenase-like Zn-dependent dehydrogenase
MKALGYLSQQGKALRDRPKPAIAASTDAIVKVMRTTIRETDLQILKGDVRTFTPVRILDHEGVGSVESLVSLSDILQTAMECDVLNRKAQPGSSVAIVGCGSIGLAGLLTAKFYSPAEIIDIDQDDGRLAVANQFGSTATINSSDTRAAEAAMKLIAQRGADTATEAVGVPASFALCQQIIADSATPTLLKTLCSRQLDPKPLISHRFKLNDILEAPETFAHAAITHSLKVIIEIQQPERTYDFLLPKHQPQHRQAAQELRSFEQCSA